MSYRENASLNAAIEKFISTWYGTIIGAQVQRMYENGTNYESICELVGIDYEDYEE